MFIVDSWADSGGWHWGKEPPPLKKIILKKKFGGGSYIKYIIFPIK